MILCEIDGEPVECSCERRRVHRLEDALGEGATIVRWVSSRSVAELARRALSRVGPACVVVDLRGEPPSYAVVKGSVGGLPSWASVLERQNPEEWW